MVANLNQTQVGVNVSSRTTKAVTSMTMPASATKGGGDRGEWYFERADTGAASTTYLTDADLTNCPSGGVYKATVTNNDGSESQQCFDVLARVTRNLSKHFDGTWVAQDTEYDNLGRNKRVSAPYQIIGGSVYWTTFRYDLLGRPTQVVLPDGSDSTTSYSGLQTTVTNDLGHSRTEVENVLGETVQVIDNLSNSTYYTYDALGNMLTMTDSASNVTTLTYDVLSRKKTMNDPDKGFWQCSYNAFGELISQDDAKNQSSVMDYDLSGRLIQREDFKADNSTEGNTSWTCNNTSSGNGPGQLTQVSDSVSGHSQTISYDEYGRIQETVTSIGVNGADGVYSNFATYDKYGRAYQGLDAADDASGYSGQGFQGTQNVYNAHGYLSKIEDVVRLGDGSARETFREITAMDARGNVTHETRGDGAHVIYTFDALTGRLEKIDGAH